jgi:hypothetical protein
LANFRERGVSPRRAPFDLSCANNIAASSNTLKLGKQLAQCVDIHASPVKLMSPLSNFLKFGVNILLRWYEKSTMFQTQRSQTWYFFLFYAENIKLFFQFEFSRAIPSSCGVKKRLSPWHRCRPVASHQKAKTADVKMVLFRCL